MLNAGVVYKNIDTSEQFFSPLDQLQRFVGVRQIGADISYEALVTNFTGEALSITHTLDSVDDHSKPGGSELSRDCKPDTLR